MDERSDAEVYRAHAEELTRFATALVGPADAPDVVSEAMLRVMASRVWGTAENRRALLYRAVMFEARSSVRSAMRRRRREQLAARRGAIEDTPALQPEVWAAVARLSRQQRAVVFLTYWHDFDVATVADLLDVSDGTVRKQLARARTRLREVLT